MAQSTTPAKLSVACEERMEVTLVERVLELTRPPGPERVEITLDKWCRRDPAEVLHADHIRRHTLIDDNPSSG